MTIDPDPGLREELLVAIAVLDPEIDGLMELMNASISEEAKESVEGVLGERSRWRDLIRSLILAMDQVVSLWNKLKSDGYPVLPPVQVEAVIIQEIQDNLNNRVIAASLFGAGRLSPDPVVARRDAGIKVSAVD